MQNLGRILGGVAFIVVIAIAWFFQQGGLAKFTHNQQAGSAQISSANTTAIDTGTAPPQPPATAPDGYKPDTDTLKAIVTNGLVRVSVQNPSAPFYNDENGGPAHGLTWISPSSCSQTLPFRRAVSRWWSTRTTR